MVLKGYIKNFDFEPVSITIQLRDICDIGKHHLHEAHVQSESTADEVLTMMKEIQETVKQRGYF